MSARSRGKIGWTMHRLGACVIQMDLFDCGSGFPKCDWRCMLLVHIRCLAHGASADSPIKRPCKITEAWSPMQAAPKGHPSSLVFHDTTSEVIE